VVLAQRDPTLFVQTVWIEHRPRKRITKYRHRLIEGDAVLAALLTDFAVSQSNAMRMATP
jgi:hypothetical protein